MAFSIFKEFAVQHFSITPEIKARFRDESVCVRCGMCCHSGITIKGRMILLKDLPCRHLFYEREGFATCRVYNDRGKLGWCNKMNAWNVARGLFPDHCTYVQGIKNYSGKVLVSDREFKELIPDLKKIFRDFPKPDYISTPVWKRFIYEVLGLPGP